MTSGGRRPPDTHGRSADDDASTGADDPATRGMEALQNAAQEMIAAARAMLDVADDFVRDPRNADGLLSTLNAIVRVATSSAATSRPAEGDTAGSDDDDDGEGRVQHIPVS